MKTAWKQEWLTCVWNIYCVLDNSVEHSIWTSCLEAGGNVTSLQI